MASIEIQNYARIAQNPDALYAAAFGAINANPVVKAALSPLAHEIFSVGYTAVSKIAGQAAGELSSAALGQLSSLIGEETMAAAAGVVASVASIVGEAVPLVNMAISMAMIAGSIGAEQSAARLQYAHEQCAYFARMPPGSGPGGEILPADLFAPDPWIWTVQPPEARAVYWYRPMSPIGTVLVAITEDNLQVGIRGPNGPATPWCWDNNMLHDPSVLDSMNPGSARPVFWESHPEQPNVGIPGPRRELYRVLRMAIGSHSAKDQGGKALMGLYLDMLCDDFAAGRMTGEWACFLCDFQYSCPAGTMMRVDPDINNDPNVWSGGSPFAPCPQALFIDYVHAIGAMAANWASVRNTKKEQMKLKLGTLDAAFIKMILGNPGLNAPARAYWQAKADAMGLGVEGRVASLLAQPYAGNSGLSFPIETVFALDALRRGVPLPKRALPKIKLDFGEGGVDFIKSILANPGLNAPARAYWQKKLAEAGG